MTEVRGLEEHEWRRWRQVRLAALADAPEMFGSTYAEWVDADEARWRSRLADVPLHALATVDGQVAGVVSVAHGEHPPDMELISMWVAPQARGQRVGDLLVRYAIDWVAEHAPDADLRLQVRRHNVHAIALYERHGFTVVGVNSQDRCEVTMRRAVRTQ